MASSDGQHQASHQSSQPFAYDIEEILRQNEEVWEAYQSGRFDLSSSLYDSVNKKIVLRERPGSTCSDKNSEYTVRKYRVTISHRNTNKSDEHLLLVSFCNNNTNQSAPPPPQQVSYNVTSHSMAATLVLPQPQQPQLLQPAAEPAPHQPLAGPGLDYIAQLIEGEDECQQQQAQQAALQEAAQLQSFPQQAGFDAAAFGAVDSYGAALGAALCNTNGSGDLFAAAAAAFYSNSGSFNGGAYGFGLPPALPPPCGPPLDASLFQSRR